MKLDNKAKNALKQSIAHHKEMSEWVKTKNPNSRPSSKRMMEEINQNWGGEYCALCKEYFEERRCVKCLLYQTGQYCENEGSYWDRLFFSETWGEWLEWDAKLIDHMKKILKGEIGELEWLR